MSERPCIHVTLLPGTDVSLYRWVHMGAEEEGVPCRQVEGQAGDLTALAYEAARSSRFHIGVALSAETAVLHEMHMPPEQPVLSEPLVEQPRFICRLMGANAARMVVRKPFRFADDEDAPPSPKQSAAPLPMETESKAETNADPVSQTNKLVSTDDLAQLTTIVALVVQKLQERGIR
ncbi:MAG: glycerol dehydratase reactivase beta/small subunit family protein [Chloroflexota bacterium]